VEELELVWVALVEQQELQTLAVAVGVASKAKLVELVALES
jgi:hypothetical protein